MLFSSKVDVDDEEVRRKQERDWYLEETGNRYPSKHKWQLLLLGHHLRLIHSCFLQTFVSNKKSDYCDQQCMTSASCFQNQCFHWTLRLLSLTVSQIICICVQCQKGCSDPYISVCAGARAAGCQPAVFHLLTFCWFPARPADLLGFCAHLWLSFISLSFKRDVYFTKEIRAIRNVLRSTALCVNRMQPTLPNETKMLQIVMTED